MSFNLPSIYGKKKNLTKQKSNDKKVKLNKKNNNDYCKITNSLQKHGKKSYSDGSINKKTVQKIKNKSNSGDLNYNQPLPEIAKLKLEYLSNYIERYKTKNLNAPALSISRFEGESNKKYEYGVGWFFIDAEKEMKKALKEKTMGRKKGKKKKKKINAKKLTKQKNT